MVLGLSGGAVNSSLLVDKLERIKSSVATMQVVLSFRASVHVVVQLLQELFAVISSKCSCMSTIILIEYTLAEELNMLHFHSLTHERQRTVGRRAVLGKR